MQFNTSGSVSPIDIDIDIAIEFTRGRCIRYASQRLLYYPV